MSTTIDGKILWQPTEDDIANSNITHFQNWLKEHKQLDFTSVQALWKWSTDELETFWAYVWEYGEVKASTPYEEVLSDRRMPGAQWFKGAHLNYAEHSFRQAVPDKTALIFQSEHKKYTEVSWAELQQKTAAVAQYLKERGVKKGDRVVAYMPNLPETVIAFLACASIGAVWSSCSPDFGANSVIDRFKQIDPVFLFAIDGYQYNGQLHNKKEVVERIQQEVPSIRETILIPYMDCIPLGELQYTTSWATVLDREAALSFEQVPFDHPLWILYSSGTTGLPKPIVHGHGGILIDQIKTLMIEQNLTENDRMFWFTTTGWMMWNLLLGGLVVGSTIVLYDGSPSYPNLGVLWDYVNKSETTMFGTSAAYIDVCMKFGFKPNDHFPLTNLHSILATASPLTANAFTWVYGNVKDDIWLASTSGGTDVCTAFVGGSPVLPVRAGIIPTRTLGVKVESYDENGNPLYNDVGELVVTAPMPSMPLFLWNDENNERYLESYFDMYPNIWRHGDWIQINDDGSCVIYGRSDSTINRSGLRMGTSEIYKIVEAMPEIMESLVIDLEYSGKESFLPLFIVLKPEASFTEELKQTINRRIRKNLSPRFVPDAIYEIKEVPKTLNGKKLEVPVRKILLGKDLHSSINRDAMANPHSLQYFIDFSATLQN
ncbi:MAG: acetoacetate--CoA ligase [Lysinibacillus sp.]